MVSVEQQISSSFAFDVDYRTRPGPRSFLGQVSPRLLRSFLLRVGAELQNRLRGSAFPGQRSRSAYVSFPHQEGRWGHLGLFFYSSLEPLLPQAMLAKSVLKLSCCCDLVSTIQTWINQQKQSPFNSSSFIIKHSSWFRKEQMNKINFQFHISRISFPLKDCST
jgi:hypothetical protein